MQFDNIQPGCIVVCPAFYHDETRTWFNTAKRRKVAFLVINEFGVELSRAHWYQTDKGPLCIDATFIKYSLLIEPSEQEAPTCRPTI